MFQVDIADNMNIILSERVQSDLYIHVTREDNVVFVRICLFEHDNDLTDNELKIQNITVIVSISNKKQMLISTDRESITVSNETFKHNKINYFNFTFGLNKDTLQRVDVKYGEQYFHENTLTVEF